MSYPDHDRAVRDLWWAVEGLPITQEQRHILTWLEMWEPESIDAISQVIEMARSTLPIERSPK
jgi:hypothetical protein